MGDTQRSLSTAGKFKKAFRIPRPPHLIREKVTYGLKQHEGPSFLDLPGEIRNKIYHYALGTGTRRVPRCPNTKEWANTNKPDGGCNLLLLCRQIGFEAGTLFSNWATAYIPITIHLDIPNILIRHARDAPIRPWESTIRSALDETKDLHLHLHLEFVRYYAIQGVFVRLLDTLAYVAFKRSRCWGEQRRNITVHLDHFLANDWKDTVTHEEGSLWLLINKMGRMTDVDFTLAYYVHTGHEEKVPSRRWWDIQVDRLEKLVFKCARYSNITVRPEIRGVGKWKELSWPKKWQDLVSTDVTPQSKLWPSIGEDFHGPSGVHARYVQEERVRRGIGSGVASHLRPL
jgi:hypothetical protein